MKSQEINDIILRSESKMQSAKILFENCQYMDCITSAYYAVFHIITACILTKGLFFSKHGQVIGAFNKEFINSDIFPKDFSKNIQILFEDRQNSDYNVIFKADRDLAEKHLENTEIIINAVNKYINELK
ncbi:MAG TPA: HEPN domain-containing protein [Spirochaetota bacterium]|nr:HEPN domain-containing protein [Spirochaetota bacterium]